MEAWGQRVVELGEGLILAARVALHGGVRPVALGVADLVEEGGLASLLGRGPVLFAGGRHFSRQQQGEG